MEDLSQRRQKMEYRLKEISAIYNDLVKDYKANPTPSGREEIIKLKTYLERIKAGFAVIAKEEFDIEQKRLADIEEKRKEQVSREFFETKDIRKAKAIELEKLNKPYNDFRQATPIIEQIEKLEQEIRRPTFTIETCNKLYKSIDTEDFINESDGSTGRVIRPSEKGFSNPRFDRPFLLIEIDNYRKENIEKIWIWGLHYSPLYESFKLTDKKLPLLIKLILDRERGDGIGVIYLSGRDIYNVSKKDISPNITSTFVDKVNSQIPIKIENLTEIYTRLTGNAPQGYIKHLTLIPEKYS